MRYITVSSAISIANVNVLRITRSLTSSAKFSTMDIPVSRGLPIIGNLLALLRAGGASNLHHYIDKRHKKHGVIFKEKLGANVHAVFISDPDMMRAVFAKEGKHPVHVLPEAWTLYNELYGCARGLFFMNGTEWLHHRRVMNNFLLKSGPEDFMKEAIEASAGSLNLLQWEHNLEEALYRWSLDTIIAVMLGKKLYLECKSDINEKLDTASHKIKLIFETSAQLQFMPIRLAHRLGLRIWRDFVQAVDDALINTSGLVYELMRISQNTGLNSTYDMGVISLMRSSQIAPSDIIKIVVDLVLAAGDTTAYTMQWVLYSLAKHPEYQNCIEASDIKNLMRETLRLYPVAPFLTRINTDHDIVAGNYYIPRNTLIIYSLYTVGRDEKYFYQPNKFNPERWRSKTPQMMQASLPFAMGARSCIGRRIAEIQLMSTLQKVLKSYSIRLQQPNEDIDMILKLISVPSKPIRLIFKEKY
ncbi:cytochrome P450 315a1, mitochondrial [Atheta coriaria]|uniref:cytochrome P450 315a1, mitochondrial n=1 Tax=Dalotia coriaria TaxID=877792 RepID=UPI0031F43EC0